MAKGLQISILPLSALERQRRIRPEDLPGLRSELVEGASGTTAETAQSAAV